MTQERAYLWLSVVPTRAHDFAMQLNVWYRKGLLRGCQWSPQECMAFNAIERTVQEGATSWLSVVPKNVHGFAMQWNM